jgi:hypothetical protein
MQMSQLNIAHNSSDHFLGAGFAAGFAAAPPPAIFIPATAAARPSAQAAEGFFSDFSPLP